MWYSFGEKYYFSKYTVIIPRGGFPLNLEELDELDYGSVVDVYCTKQKGLNYDFTATSVLLKCDMNRVETDLTDILYGISEEEEKWNILKKLEHFWH